MEYIMKINEGFLEKFLSGVVKRKIDKGMKKIMQDDPRVANAVRDARDANERLRRALEKRLGK